MAAQAMPLAVSCLGRGGVGKSELAGWAVCPGQPCNTLHPPGWHGRARLVVAQVDEWQERQVMACGSVNACRGAFVW